MTSSAKENAFKKSASDHFTIESILEWSREIEAKLADDKNYNIKIAAEHELQREVEHQWVESDPKSSNRLTFGINQVNGRKISKLVHAYPDCNFFSARTFLNDTLSSIDSKLNPITNFFDVDFVPGHKRETPDHAVAIHEINCRLNALNSLRLIIPNFQYLYGYGKTDNTGELFLLNEKKGGNVVRTFKEAILESNEKCTLREFCSLFLQITFALKIASEAVHFTHYSLSPENVQLILPDGITEGEEFFIPYNTESICAFVKAPYIARFTDLGNAHVKCENSMRRDVSFGSPNNSASSTPSCTYRDRSNVMTDVYRFILLSYKARKAYLTKLNSSSDNADGILTFCADVIKYFNSTDTSLDEIIEKTESETNLNFPITHYSRVFTMSDFINHTKKQIPKTLVKESGKGRLFCLTVPDNSKVLLYGSGIIKTHVPTITSGVSDGLYFVQPNLTVENFYDLYTFYSSLDLEYEMKAVATDFIQGFSKEKSAFNSAFSDITKQAHEISNKLKVIGGGGADGGGSSGKVPVLQFINMLRRYQNIFIRIRLIKLLIHIYWKPTAVVQSPVRSSSVGSSSVASGGAKARHRSHSILTESDREKSVSKVAIKSNVPKNVRDLELGLVKSVRNVIASLHSMEKSVARISKPVEEQIASYKRELLI